MRRTVCFCVGIVSIVTFCGSMGLSADKVATPAPPPAPKVSTFAPAEDLVRQADQYMKDLDKIVEAPDAYKDDNDKIGKLSNTLVIIALSLGLHDEPNKYRDQAAAIIKTAQSLAALAQQADKKEKKDDADYEAAKKATAAVRQAARKQAAGVELKWEKAASLPELMKQVPLINMHLKRYLKPEKFKKKAQDLAGHTAVIAVIAQGSIADTSEAKNPDQVKQWYNLMIEMRDDAGALNAAVHKTDRPAADKAMKKLAQSCEDCHAIFRPGIPANQAVKKK
jgi:hypothetical protein